MKYPDPPVTHRTRGFALVVTLTLMVLLSILALGLLSLSSVALRTTGIRSDASIARANARVALSLAIAEIQKHAGPDTTCDWKGGHAR